MLGKNNKLGNSMKIKILLFALIAMLTGCVTITPNFAVKQNFWNDKSKTIGVVIGNMPKPTAHKGGSQGLLDILINNENASDLETHLQTLDVSSIKNVAFKMSKYLKGKGLKVKTFKNTLNLDALSDFEAENNDAKKIYYADRDYRGLKKKYGVDKLLVVNIVRIGTLRTYHGFIPTGDPSGLSHLGGYVVDLSNNQLEWKQTVVNQIPHNSAEWDAPPKFDALTKAMYTAFKQSKSMLFNHFAQ